MLNTTGLRLDQGPPIHVPFRFFLTAPFFTVLSALALLHQGEALLASRWVPGTLAITHWMAIGFLGQIMAGTLLQMLPVIAGAPVPRVQHFGWVLHLSLSMGAALLGAGLWYSHPPLLLTGALLAALGFSALLLAIWLALYRRRGSGQQIRGIGFAAFSLGVTVLFGFLLAATLGGWLQLSDLLVWVNLHLAWAFLGWVGLLIASISIQLVPLFYVTPNYPVWLIRSLGPLILLALCLGTLFALFQQPAAARVAFGTAVAAWMVFGSITLYLQHERRRQRMDPTLLHWWVALLCALVAGILWSLEGPPVVLGILLFFGLATGLSAGMLFKIIPFLTWFHLQSQQLGAGHLRVRVPNMRTLLPENWAYLQVALHLIALLCLLAAWAEPSWTSLAACFLGSEAVILLVLILRNLWYFRRVAGRISAASSAQA